MVNNQFFEVQLARSQADTIMRPIAQQMSPSQNDMSLSLNIIKHGEEVNDTADCSVERRTLHSTIHHARV